MTISLIFLRLYIEFQKLLGNDDQITSNICIL